jgi:uncharacterized membrane protein
MDESGVKPRRMSMGQVERFLWFLGGGAFLAYGLLRRSSGRAAAIFFGGAMVYQGVNRHRHPHAALGARKTTKGFKVVENIGVERPPDELYRFWRDVENLPRFMEHLKAVRWLDDRRRRSHWVAKGPAGVSVEWDAEIVRDIENELISWQSLENADVFNAGSVSFRRTPDGLGTEMKVVLRYLPPAGAVGAAVARVLGEDPSRQIRSELERFKRLAEAGELASAARP